MEDEFRTFLEEVGRLSLHHDAVDGNDSNGKKTAAINNNADEDIDGGRVDVRVKAEEDVKASASIAPSSSSSVAVVKGNAKRTSRKEKKNMIAHANEGQKAWSEFKKLDLSKQPRDEQSSSPSSSSKVSFQIKSVKDAKKKKKSKKKQQQNQSIDIANDKEQGCQQQHEQSIDKQRRPEAPIESPYNNNNTHETIYQYCPRWTLIVDTSSLLHDRGTGLQPLFDVANRASARHDDNASSTLHQHSAITTTSIIEEPIEIVVPFKVWSELEYQSKKNSNLNEEEEEKRCYAARNVIRTLRNELHQQQHGSNIGMQFPKSKNVLRSQSLAESKEAASQFLDNNIDSTQQQRHWTNDDYILACAMKEHQNHNQTNIHQSATSPKAVTAGGAVILTLDNNLACKAYANGLKVYSTPQEFVEYYERRMTSLRQRARCNLIDSALRRWW